MPVQRPYNPNAKRIAELMQADLAKVGVKAEIKTFEWGEYRKRMQAGEHQMGMLGWTGDNGDPDNFLHTLLGCDSAKANGSNVAKFCHQPFEDLVLKAKTVTKPAERDALYKQAQVIFKEQAPWFTIAHAVQLKPVRKEVIDFKLSPVRPPQLLRRGHQGVKAVTPAAAGAQGLPGSGRKAGLFLLRCEFRAKISLGTHAHRHRRRHARGTCRGPGPDARRAEAGRCGREFWVGHLHGQEVVAVLSRIGKVAAATTATVADRALRGRSHRVHRRRRRPGARRERRRRGGGRRLPAARPGRLADLPAATKCRSMAPAASPTDAALTGQLAAAVRQALPGARLHRGLVVSGDRFVATAAESRALQAALPDALAVEMEGAAFAQVCHDYGMPFAAVRTVSDRADDDGARRFPALHPGGRQPALGGDRATALLRSAYAVDSQVRPRVQSDARRPAQAVGAAQVDGPRSLTIAQRAPARTKCVAPRR